MFYMYAWEKLPKENYHVNFSLMKFLWYLLHNFRKSPIKPPSQMSPGSPSNKPPLYIKPSTPPPPPGMVYYFTNWKFTFDSDPQLLDLQPSYSWASPPCSIYLWRTDTIVFSKLNNPPPPLKWAWNRGVTTEFCVLWLKALSNDFCRFT